MLCNFRAENSRSKKSSKAVCTCTLGPQKWIIYKKVQFYDMYNDFSIVLGAQFQNCCCIRLVFCGFQRRQNLFFLLNQENL